MLTSSSALGYNTARHTEPLPGLNTVCVLFGIPVIAMVPSPWSTISSCQLVVRSVFNILKEFKKLGASILGIEPATNLSELANQSNITTKNTFFSSQVSKEIIKSRHASVVIANNVIAHIEDLQDLMSGIKTLIGNHGVFIFEVPYLVDLIKNLEFDTVYHEHLSYFSILPLLTLMRCLHLLICL